MSEERDVLTMLLEAAAAKGLPIDVLREAEREVRAQCSGKRFYVASTSAAQRDQLAQWLGEAVARGTSAARAFDHVGIDPRTGYRLLNRKTRQRS